MIRTKQITVVCASVALLCILCAQAFATRSASPNYATNSHEDMSLYYYGYVQCQPSYNEDGKHAQPAIYAIGGMTFWAILSMTQVDSILPMAPTRQILAY